MKSSVQLWLARAHVKASTAVTLCMSKARKLRAAALGGSERFIFIFIFIIFMARTMLEAAVP